MERYSVYLKLLGMAVLWGASWPMGRMLGQSLPPLTGGAVRFVLVSVLLLGWLFARSRFATLAALSARQWLGLTAAASVGVCGYAVFFMLGLQTMPAGKAAVVVALNPVLTLLLATWFFGECLNAKILAGMLLAVGGAIMVVTQGQPLTVLSGGIKAGEWLIFGCVVCWAAYTLIGRAVLRGIDALTVTTATSFIGALMLSAVALWTDGVPFGVIVAMDGRGRRLGVAGHRRDGIGLCVVFRRREDFGCRQRGGVYYARADFRCTVFGMVFGRTVAYFAGCRLCSGSRRHDADAVRAEGRLKLGKYSDFGRWGCDCQAVAGHNLM